MELQVPYCICLEISERENIAIRIISEIISEVAFQNADQLVLCIIRIVNEKITVAVHLRNITQIIIQIRIRINCCSVYLCGITRNLRGDSVARKAMFAKNFVLEFIKLKNNIHICLRVFSC